MRYPEQDAQSLNSFYESATWPIFKKYFLEQRRLALLESSTIAQTFEDVKFYRGGIDHIEWLEREFKEIHKQMLKLEESEGEKS